MNRSTRSLGVGVVSLCFLLSLAAKAQPCPARSFLESDVSSSADVPAENTSETATASPESVRSDSEIVINFIHHFNSIAMSAGREVLDRLGNQKVRELAQMMIVDHQKTEDQVISLAAQKGWKLFNFQLSTVEMAVASQLKALTAPMVDLSFLRVQLMEHEKVLQVLKFLESQIVDADLLNLVKQSLATVQSHVELLTSTVDSLAVEGGTNTPTTPTTPITTTTTTTPTTPGENT